MGTQGVGPWQSAAVEYASLARRGVRLAGAARRGSSIQLWNANDEPVWKSPSAVLAADGRTVTAHFAEVRKLAGVAAADFGLVGADGPAATIMAVAATAKPLGDTRVRLTFAEPVKLPAAWCMTRATRPRRP